MFKVNIVKVANFTPDQKEKLDHAKFLWEKVQNSEEFKRRVLNFRYKETSVTGSLWWKKEVVKIVEKFRMNNGLTNRQVYDFLMKGAETLNPVSNNAADIEITMYFASNSTVGYTYPTTTMQWINKKFFSVFTPPDIAGNLAHEWCHKLGFVHEEKYNPLRAYTIPYAIGDIVKDLSEQYDKHPRTWKMVGTAMVENYE